MRQYKNAWAPYNREAVKLFKNLNRRNFEVSNFRRYFFDLSTQLLALKKVIWYSKTTER